jgi:hypothetical protein
MQGIIKRENGMEYSPRAFFLKFAPQSDIIAMKGLTPSIENAAYQWEVADNEEANSMLEELYTEISRQIPVNKLSYGYYFVGTY